MPVPANFMGRRLRRRAWTIPFTLSFAPVAVAALFVVAPLLAQDVTLLAEPVALAEYVWFTLTPWPFAIAAFFSLIGFLRGVSFGGSGQRYLNERLSVRKLEPSAPLAQRVARIAETLDLPPPQVGTMPVANAYAIGSSINDAAVVIGTPLIQQLTDAELDAIIGHELGHIVSGDMKRMQMAAGYQAMVHHFVDGSVKGLEKKAHTSKEHAIPLLIAWLFALLFRRTVFIFSELLVMALSRSREYVADAFGALVTSRETMASALAKLHGIAPPKPELRDCHQSLMFWSPGGAWMSTHPTVDKRLSAITEGKHLGRLLRKAGPADTAEKSQPVLQHKNKPRPHIGVLQADPSTSSRRMPSAPGAASPPPQARQTWARARRPEQIEATFADVSAVPEQRSKSTRRVSQHQVAMTRRPASDVLLDVMVDWVWVWMPGFAALGFYIVYSAL